MTIINCLCIVVYQSVDQEYIQGGAQKAEELYGSVTVLKTIDIILYFKLCSYCNNTESLPE